MDLLIHLIIWLFKALFGEQEPPAQLGPRNRRGDEDTSTTTRGPYDYGDGRPARSGQAKTLAELLEEARRQTQGGQGERPQPVQPPPRPVVVAPPPPPRPVAPPPQPIAPLPVEVPQLVVPPPTLPPPAPVSAGQPAKRSKKRKKAAAQAMARPLAPVAAPGAIYSTQGARAARTMATMVAASLRGANPEKKREALIKAVVLTEIFNPPRSRRALRR